MYSDKLFSLVTENLEDSEDIETFTNLYNNAKELLAECEETERKFKHLMQAGTVTKIECATMILANVARIRKALEPLTAYIVLPLASEVLKKESSSSKSQTFNFLFSSGESEEQS
ncbi:MAG: hypothetical protein RLZZ176_2428 [Cyanobacteriota bacterium]|jgi:hypothetical protein